MEYKGGWTNVYSSPEKFGLQIVGSIQVPPDYNFDMVVVWQHADGTFFWAQDHGCSCPSPFEDYRSVSSLTRMNSDEAFAFFEHFVLEKWAGPCWGWDPEREECIENSLNPSRADRKEFLHKIDKLYSMPGVSRYAQIRAELDQVLSHSQ
jgi:hypothetical protein